MTFLRLIFTGRVNGAAIVTGLVCIIILIGVDQVNGLLRKYIRKIPVHIPAQLIVVGLMCFLFNMSSWPFLPTYICAKHYYTCYQWPHYTYQCYPLLTNCVIGHSSNKYFIWCKTPQSIWSPYYWDNRRHTPRKMVSTFTSNTILAEKFYGDYISVHVCVCV